MRHSNELNSTSFFSSKGSRIENQKFPEEIIENESKMEELETNKFWDFSRNIDLEDFDTQRVYRILMNQDRFIRHLMGHFEMGYFEMISSNGMPVNQISQLMSLQD